MSSCRKTWIRRLAVAVSALAVLASVPAATASPTDDVRVLVRGLDVSDAAGAVGAAGGTVTATLEIVDAVAATVPASSMAALEASPGVRSVDRDDTVSVHGHRSSSTISPPANASALTVMGANKLAAAGLTGAGVNVAVIDTGIQNLPDFAGRLVGGVDFSGEGNPFADSFGHGTFIAGLIAGNGASGAAYPGVAPGAGLVSVKIAGASGSTDTSNLLAALQWIVSYRADLGIKVVNLSLGTDSSQSYRLSLLNFAVEKAWDAGITVVVSSSNSGPDAKTVTKPADDPLVITVGALDHKNNTTASDDAVAAFSGRGPTRADGLIKPDLVAPGTYIVSLRVPGSTLDTGYPSARMDATHFRGSGTSFSTAYAAGIAAQILAAQPWLTPDQVKYRLTHTTAPAPSSDPNAAGSGTLDAWAAVTGTSTASANANVTRSTGTGSYELDRGTLVVDLHVDDVLQPVFGLLGIVGWVLQPVFVVLEGLLTAQGAAFDQAEYLADASWQGRSWHSSQWAGRSWHGTSWHGTSWYGSSWHGTSWYGRSWA